MGESQSAPTGFEFGVDDGYRIRATGLKTEGAHAVPKRGFRGDWVDFAAFLMMLMGAVDFFQGLIAVVRNDYYSFDPNEIIVVDLTAWGWILLFWGSLVALAGVGLWLRSDLARWAALVLVTLNLIVELGFAGAHNYPLWGLVSNALAVVVLYALVVHWHPADDNA
jgi:hypothetical protein